MNGYGRRRCQYFLPGKGEEILENSRRPERASSSAASCVKKEEKT